MTIVLPRQVGLKDGTVLFQKAKDITDILESKNIVKSLKDTLEYYGGVGLAAPQIGISKRVFAVYMKPTKNHPQLPNIGFKAYINPVIHNQSPDTDKDLEGCLSIWYGTLFGLVKRSVSLHITYLNTNGEEQTEHIAYPFLSRVLSHEADHLDGKIIFHRIEKRDISTLLWKENLNIKHTAEKDT